MLGKDLSLRVGMRMKRASCVSLVILPYAHIGFFLVYTIICKNRFIFTVLKARESKVEGPTFGKGLGAVSSHGGRTRRLWWQNSLL